MECVDCTVVVRVVLEEEIVKGNAWSVRCDCGFFSQLIRMVHEIKEHFDTWPSPARYRPLPAKFTSGGKVCWPTYVAQPSFKGAMYSYTRFI